MVEANPENLIQITSEAQYEKAIAEHKYVIADFNATWCPPCKRMKPILLKLAEKNPALTILNVDADINKALAGKFKISAIPTLILYCDGKKEKSTSGFDEDFLKKEIVKVMPDYQYI